MLHKLITSNFIATPHIYSNNSNIIATIFFSAINFFFLVVNYLCKRWDTYCETWEELIKCVNHHVNVIFQGSNNGQGGGQGVGGDGNTSQGNGNGWGGNS